MRLDIIFVLDEALHDEEEDFRSWDKSLSFVRQLVAQFTIDEAHAKIGIITYGNEAQIRWPVNRYCGSFIIFFSLQCRELYCYIIANLLL